MYRNVMGVLSGIHLIIINKIINDDETKATYSSANSNGEFPPKIDQTHKIFIKG